MRRLVLHPTSELPNDTPVQEFDFLGTYGAPSPPLG